MLLFISHTGLQLPCLSSQNDLPIHGNAFTHTNPAHKELSGYHDVTVHLLDGMQILRNQCSDGFQDTAKHVTAIDFANAYLTLAQGSRCFVVSPVVLLSPPRCAVCGCYVWKCDGKQNAMPNVK